MFSVLVIHTVAHLINVINFSKNFNPLLSNLNMAEYQGQNPFQLLISGKYFSNLISLFFLIITGFVMNVCSDSEDVIKVIIQLVVSSRATGLESSNERVHEKPI